MSDLLESVTALANACPAQIKESVIHAIGALVGAAVDLPVAYLQGKAQAFRDDAAGRSLVSRAAAEAAAARIGADPALAGRAVDHFAERMLREQRNREAVAALTVKELTEKPPTEPNARPISDDWLGMFGRVAESVSEDTARLHLAKLLAEEIRKPGSFSPAALQILSFMSPETAELFRRLCSVLVTFPAVSNELVFVVADPFGAPGQNGLSAFGLGYWELLKLQSAGLVHTDLSAWREAPAILFFSGVSVGGVEIKPAPGETPAIVYFQTKIRMNVVNLTPPGVELSRLVETLPNSSYQEGLSKWIDDRLAAIADAVSG